MCIDQAKLTPLGHTVIFMKDAGSSLFSVFSNPVCPIVKRMRPFTRQTETFQMTLDMNSCIVINSD